MRLLLVVQVVLLGVTFALSPPQDKLVAKLLRNKRDAFPSSATRWNDNDNREWGSPPDGPVGPPIHSGGDGQPLNRDKREQVDRILSLFGGSFYSRPHHRQNNWRPSPPRPHLGNHNKHGRHPQHKFHHHGHKAHGPPKHHGSGFKHHGPPKHHDIHHGDHHDEHHHHYFEEHHIDGGSSHGGDDHHGDTVHYDDHSLNDIHDYPEYVVEYAEFDDHHKFEPSPPDIHHDYSDYQTHNDHDFSHSHEFDDGPHHDHGYLKGITTNNIYRDDVPFKEVVNDNDKIHDGLIPGGVKGLDPDLISFIRDKSRPYVIGAL